MYRARTVRRWVEIPLKRNSKERKQQTEHRYQLKNILDLSKNRLLGYGFLTGNFRLRKYLVILVLEDMEECRFCEEEEEKS